MRNSPSILHATSRFGALLSVVRRWIIATAGAALWTQLLIMPAPAADNGIEIDRGKYANRPLRRSPFPQSCPNTERSLVQISGNLYRHTNQTWPAVHIHQLQC